MGAYDATRNAIIQNAESEEADNWTERGGGGDRPHPYRGGEQPENRRGSSLQVSALCMTIKCVTWGQREVQISRYPR